MKKNWFWFVVLGLLMPLAQIVRVIIGFPPLTGEEVLSSLVFAPVGLVGAWVMFWFVNKAKSAEQKRAAVIGFVFFFPISFYMALASAMAFYWVVPLIFGIPLLVVGTAFGYWMGGKVSHQAKA